MPRPTKGPRLGGSPAHERLMLANLATSLFEHNRITTTETKARRLRPFAERLITKAKRGDLHSRRQVHAVIRNKDIVHKLFAELGPLFENRPGGYTRITKLGPRKGDNAPLAVIELVGALEVAATTAPAPAAKTAEPKPDEKAPEAAETETVDAEADGPYGAGSIDANEDGSSPDADFAIKGNADSRKYHTPDGQWYEQTHAEVYFKTEDDAKAAGFDKAGETSDDES